MSIHVYEHLNKFCFNFVTIPSYAVMEFLSFVSLEKNKQRILYLLHGPQPRPVFHINQSQVGLVCRHHAETLVVDHCSVQDTLTSIKQYGQQHVKPGSHGTCYNYETVIIKHRVLMFIGKLR